MKNDNEEVLLISKEKVTKLLIGGSVFAAGFIVRNINYFETPFFYTLTGMAMGASGYAMVKEIQNGFVSVKTDISNIVKPATQEEKENAPVKEIIVSRQVVNTTQNQTSNVNVSSSKEEGLKELSTIDKIFVKIDTTLSKEGLQALLLSLTSGKKQSNTSLSERMKDMTSMPRTDLEEKSIEFEEEKTR